MRQALISPRGRRKQPQPQQKSVEANWPAPVEGWDTETLAFELPPSRAIVCDNWVPRGIQLEMRKGMSEHATGLDGDVETLMAYNSATQETLFAASVAEIHDVTSAGAVGAAVVSSLTSARFSWVNFTTSGGSFLWICNGVDDPRHWNGSAWAVPALTMFGTLLDNDIFYVFESKERLFFLVNNSLSFGYLPVSSVAGTVAEFPLGASFSRGGRLVAGGTLTHDGGSGPDDYTVFLTSEGEVAVFQGSDPGDASNWAKVGTWHVGEPVGDRPLVELDGYLSVLTRRGLVPLLQVFSGEKAFNPTVYLTERISTPFRNAVASNAGDGWQSLDYPAGDLIIINVPTVADTTVQFVRSSASGGWSRYTGWNMASLVVFQGALWGGTYDGRVMKLDVNYDDDGEEVVASLQWPWSRLQHAGIKRLVKARAVVTTQTGASLSIVARTDYAEDPAVPTPSAATLSDALIWGTGTWGDFRWGGRNLGARQWRTVSGVGNHVSFVLEARARQSRFALNGLDFIYEIGGLV
jgi:hypothetical protein